MSFKLNTIRMLSPFQSIWICLSIGFEFCDTAAAAAAAAVAGVVVYSSLLLKCNLKLRQDLNWKVFVFAFLDTRIKVFDFSHNRVRCCCHRRRLSFCSLFCTRVRIQYKKVFEIEILNQKKHIHAFACRNTHTRMHQLTQIAC